LKLLKKNNLLELAKRLSGSTRLQKNINLNELDKLNESQVLIVGKVLGQGGINKKINIAALGFSEQAKEKLNKAGCETSTIKQFIEKNTKLEGVKII